MLEGSSVRSLILVVLLTASTDLDAQVTTPAPMALVAYPCQGSIVPNCTTAQVNWIDSHFDEAYNPQMTDLLTGHPGMISTQYDYPTAMHPWLMGFLTTWALSHGYTISDLFIHQANDYAGNPVINSLDQFDYFESATTYPRVATHGVFTLVGASYTDVTAQIYSGSPTTAISDKVLIGYVFPFDRATFVLTTPQSGGSVAWSYWNGSAYAALTVTDGTSGLTVNGTITFTPPSDWARHVENGSVSKYWVRATVSGASTAPVITTIKGDGCLTGGLMRGWSTTDVNRVNVGLGDLEYNPTPPVGQTAHFKWQSMTDNNNGDQFLTYNHSNVQSSVHTVARWLIYYEDTFDPSFQPGPFNGMFMDNWCLPAYNPGIGSVGFSQMIEGLTQASNGTGTFRTGQIASMQEYATARNWYTVVNTTVANCALGSKLNAFNESGISPPEGPPAYDLAGNLSADGSLSMDAFLPANNPSGSKYVVQCYDWVWNGVLPINYPVNDTFHDWDRSNRSPILCLSYDYMGHNENTKFGYTSYSESSYADVDHFYYSNLAKSGTTSMDINSGGTPVAIHAIIGGTNANPVVFTTGIHSQGDLQWAHGLSSGQSILIDNPFNGLGLWDQDRDEWCTSIRGTHVVTVVDPTHFSIPVDCTGAGAYFGPIQYGLVVTGSFSVFNGLASQLAGLDCINNYLTVRLGSDWTCALYIDNTHLAIRSQFHQTYSSGTSIQYVDYGKRATDSVPPLNQIFRHGSWFPAAAVNIGTATGSRQANWLHGADIKGSGISCVTYGCAGVWRRDFTGAVVLFRPFCGLNCGSAPDQGGNYNEIDVPSQPFCIKSGDVYPACTGGPWYSLKADGTSGSGITSIALRSAEGAILLTSPAGPGPRRISGKARMGGKTR